MKTAEEYQPFGEEWKNELMKMPKIQIIALYRQLALAHQELEQSHKQKLAEMMPSKKDKNEYLRNQELADKYDKALFDLGFNSCFDWLKSLTESKQKDTNQ